jgi:hypothetical protein
MLAYDGTVGMQSYNRQILHWHSSEHKIQLGATFNLDNIP